MLVEPPKPNHRLDISQQCNQKLKNLGKKIPNIYQYFISSDKEKKTFLLSQLTLKQLRLSVYAIMKRNELIVFTLLHKFTRPHRYASVYYHCEMVEPQFDQNIKTKKIYS